MIKSDLPQGSKDFPISTNQCDTPTSKVKNKNHMTISTGAKKATHKIQHSSMIKKKNSQQSRYRENVPHLDKGHTKQSHS